MLQQFSFNQQHNIRVLGTPEEPWFVAKDLANALGFDYAPHAYRMLDADEKGIHKVDTLGGLQKMTCINESGLYSLILRSNKPEARQFKRWVTHEVLPSIRKTGQYATQKVSRRELAQMVLDAEQELETTKHQLHEAKTKSSLYEQSVEVASGLHDMAELAKILHTGRSRLFTALRGYGVIMKYKPLPYQKHIDNGHFVVKERPYTRGDEQFMSAKMYATTEGLYYVYKLIADGKINP